MNELGESKLNLVVLDGDAGHGCGHHGRNNDETILPIEMCLHNSMCLIVSDYA